MKPGKFVVKRKFCFLLLLLLFRKFSVLLVVGRGQKTIVALSHPVHPLSRLSLSSPSFGFLWKQTRMEGQFVMFTSVDTMEWYISEDPPSLLRWVVSEKMSSPTVYFLMVTLPAERGCGCRTIVLGFAGCGTIQDGTDLQILKFRFPLFIIKQNLRLP